MSRSSSRWCTHALQYKAPMVTPHDARRSARRTRSSHHAACMRVSVAISGLSSSLASESRVRMRFVLDPLLLLRRQLMIWQQKKTPHREHGGKARSEIVSSNCDQHFIDSVVDTADYRMHLPDYYLSVRRKYGALICAHPETRKRGSYEFSSGPFVQKSPHLHKYSAAVLSRIRSSIIFFLQSFQFLYALVLC